MKPIPLSLFSSLALITAPLAQGAEPPNTTNAPASAEKTSFREVTSQLDPGGNLYVYLGTEQWLEGLSSKIGEWRRVIDAIPDLPEEAPENIDKAFTIVTNLIKSSGLEDISGIGVSSIAREKGYYHSKLLVHHYPGRGSGFLWNLFGQKAHPLDTLNLLSTNAAIACFADVDVPLLWSTIRKQASQSGFPQATELLNELPARFEKATQLKWDQVLASLGGEYGFILTLNESRKVKIPLPGGDEPLEIPEPAILIVARTKDDTIFNRLDKALEKSGQSIVRLDKPNLKMRTITLPLPLPFPVTPTLASAEGWLFISSSDVAVQEALAVKAGSTPGLKSTAEFTRLAREIPSSGNQFTFVSQRFSRTILAVQRRAIGSTVSGSQRQWFESMLDKHSGSYFYSVAANTDEGWINVVNGNQHPGVLFLAAAVAPTAMTAAMLLPALAKAKSRAQRINCVNNLRQLEKAKKEWAVENTKPNDAVPTKTDLLPFLRGKQFPVCPAGGDYTVNAVTEHPECSIDGHSLP